MEREAIHLIDAVTTNKTDFFREPDHFRLLTENGRVRLLPVTGMNKQEEQENGINRQKDKEEMRSSENHRPWPGANDLSATGSPSTLCDFFGVIERSVPYRIEFFLQHKTPLPKLVYDRVYQKFQ